MKNLLTLACTLMLTGCAAVMSVPNQEQYVSSEPYPYVGSISMIEDGRPYCSAVLVDSQAALTAAHCISYNMYVTFDSVTYEVSHFDMASTWRILPYQSDLAVLHFDTDVHVPVDDWMAVGSRELPSKYTGYAPVRTVGYGDNLSKRITDMGSMAFIGFREYGDWMYLAKISTTLQPGDSGGAVLWNHRGREVLIGINIAVYMGPDREAVISMATRLDIHEEFIRDSIRDYQDNREPAEAGLP